MSKHRHKLQNQMNVIPFIDIMLVLLVAFMMTTPLMYPHFKVQLPTAKASSHTQTPITLSINHHQQMYLTMPGQPRHRVTRQRLSRTLKQYWQHHPKSSRKLWLAADQRLRYQTVMKTIELAKQSGAKAIGLMSQPH